MEVITTVGVYKDLLWVEVAGEIDGMLAKMESFQVHREKVLFFLARIPQRTRASIKLRHELTPIPPSRARRKDLWQLGQRSSHTPRRRSSPNAGCVQEDAKGPARVRGLRRAQAHHLRLSRHAAARAGLVACNADETEAQRRARAACACTRCMHLHKFARAAERARALQCAH
eukprot:2962018-Pleurochrysis_carterae.AAC.4